MKYSEENLIIYLSLKAGKIGKSTAYLIAGFFDGSLKDFFEVNRLYKLENSKGKPILQAERINNLQKIIDEYIPDITKPISELWIAVLIKDFVKNAIHELSNTTLETLLINPFLVKAFGFDDHKEVVTFYFYQKITRSIVTSWGFTVEGLLFCSGAENSDLSGFDMKVTRDGINYHLQIKSSPNTMSVEQVRQLNTHIQNIKDKINNIPLLGMTYGKKSQINSQVRGTLINYPESVLIGRELWDFIANENGHCQKILDLIDVVMMNEPTKFSNELEKKLFLLIADWELKYGQGKQSIEQVLQNYL